MKVLLETKQGHERVILTKYAGAYYQVVEYCSGAVIYQHLCKGYDGALNKYKEISEKLLTGSQQIGKLVE